MLFMSKTEKLFYSVLCLMVIFVVGAVGVVATITYYNAGWQILVVAACVTTVGVSMLYVIDKINHS